LNAAARIFETTDVAIAGDAAVSKYRPISSTSASAAGVQIIR
jgi:hypothetical protein